MAKCEKLPKKIDITEFHNMNVFKNILKVIFDDLVNAELFFAGKKIKVFHNQFEHFITSERENKREFDSERAARLKWVKVILESVCNECKNLWIWEDKEKPKIKIFCAKEEYLIVLGYFEKEDVYGINTAYKTRPHDKDNYRRQYNNYINQKAPTTVNAFIGSSLK